MSLYGPKLLIKIAVLPANNSIVSGDFTGKLTDLNIWNKPLHDSVEKITSGCEAELPKGAILEWSKLQFNTNVTITIAADEVCRKSVGKYLSCSTSFYK